MSVEKKTLVVGDLLFHHSDNEWGIVVETMVYDLDTGLEEASVYWSQVSGILYDDVRWLLKECDVFGN